VWNELITLVAEVFWTEGLFIRGTLTLLGVDDCLILAVHVLLLFGEAHEEDIIS
jgi:hypothetical protein